MFIAKKKNLYAKLKRVLGEHKATCDSHPRKPRATCWCPCICLPVPSWAGRHTRTQTTLGHSGLGVCAASTTLRKAGCMRTPQGQRGRRASRMVPPLPAAALSFYFSSFWGKIQKRWSKSTVCSQGGSSPASETLISDLPRDCPPCTFPEGIPQELRSLLCKSHGEVARFGEQVFTFPRKADS